MTFSAPPSVPPEPPTADREWFGGRRWTGIFAVGMLLVIVLAVALFIALRPSDTKSSGATAPGASFSAAAPRSSGTVQPSALPTEVPTAAPSGVSWSIYETVALPSAAGVGPSKTDGAIATGYARTPEGALLAAANEGVRYGLASDDQWQAAATAMLAPGPGRDAWNQLRAANPYGPGGAASDQLAQIAGFQFVSYTPTDAVIQIVTQTRTGTYQVAANHVVWEDGDWKYVLADNGSQVANVQTVPSLSGFIEWRGV